MGTPERHHADHYVSIHGEEDRAILLDCRSLTHRAVKLPGDIVIIAVNSMVKHDLAGSARMRSAFDECQEAVAQLRRAAGRNISGATGCFEFGIRRCDCVHL